MVRVMIIYMLMIYRGMKSNANEENKKGYKRLSQAILLHNKFMVFHYSSINQPIDYKASSENNPICIDYQRSASVNLNPASQKTPKNPLKNG
jgi:hypothetical protein